MRILLLVNNLVVGGAETQTVRLAEALVSLGHQVCIGYFSAANAFAAELDEQGIGYYCIRPRPNNYRPWTFHAAADRVKALCNEFAPDLVHSALELADIVGQMVTTKLHLPHVITFQNTHWWAVRNLASHWRIAHRKRWLKRGKPLLVAVSRSVARAAADALGMDERGVTVVHNGAELMVK